MVDFAGKIIVLWQSCLEDASHCLTGHSVINIPCWIACSSAVAISCCTWLFDGLAPPLNSVLPYFCSLLIEMVSIKQERREKICC